jgi:hypothetical protein
MGFFDFFKAKYPVVNTKSAVNVEWVLKALDDIGTASKTSMGFAPPLPDEPTTTKYLRQDGSWQVPPDTDTVYTHPTNPGNKHVPSGGSSGQILRWSKDGTAVWGADNNTTYSTVSKTAAGLAPQLPDETTTAKYLRQDGAWQAPPDTTYSEMSGTTLGLAKLDGNYTFTGTINVPTPNLPE